MRIGIGCTLQATYASVNQQGEEQVNCQETPDRVTVRDRIRLAAMMAVTCVLALSLFAVDSASARDIQPYEYAASFDGTGAGGAEFETVGTMAVDQVTGNVYVIDRALKRVHKFDAEGNPAPFSDPSLGGATILNLNTGVGSYIAVDNSGTATQSRIYVLENNLQAGLTSLGPFGAPSLIHALEPSGAELGGEWPLCGGPDCGKTENWTFYAQAVAVGPDGKVWVISPSPGGVVPSFIVPFTPDGVQTAPEGADRILAPTSPFRGGGLDLDGDGNLYVIDQGVAGATGVYKYASDGTFQLTPISFPTDGSQQTRDDVAVDRTRGLTFTPHIAPNHHIGAYDLSGAQVGRFGQAEGPYEGLLNSDGVAVNEATGQVYVGNAKQQTVDIFEPGTTVTVPDVSTEQPENVTGATVTLRGTIDPDGGGNTTVCRFEWGITASLGTTTNCAQGHVHASEGGEVEVSADIAGLQKGREYHYRLVTDNEAGPVQYGQDRAFRAAELPILKDVAITDINTDAAELRVGIDPQGGNTSYRVEVGETTGYGMNFPPPPADPARACFTVTGQPLACPGRLEWELGSTVVQSGSQDTIIHLTGLAPDTIYHFRVVAENDAGETTSEDRTFRTFEFIPQLIDTCPNKLSRQQTGAAQLLDCRAYELVSAADSGGYDVSSDVISGVVPLPGFPRAEDRALYSVVDGGIPGIGKPTNRGPDPYVATRNAAQERWDTDYVGVPSDAPSDEPFASRLAGADDGLSTFAFGGPDLCSPCFDDEDTNLPVRLPDGSLVKGMQGSLDPGASEPAGEIRKHFSADGTHFIFGSTSRFEPDANNNGTDVTIYDRNLSTGTTQVVSRDSGGNVIAAGDDVVGLDVSTNGERIVIGERLATDFAGNDYVLPYMHVGTTEETIELAPGSTSGVIYNGMTNDGSMVYFSTPDQLTGDDTDSSPDVYRAEPVGAGVDLTRVSTGSGGSGDSDSCLPEPNSVNGRWNSADGSAHCGAVPVGGGGGIAADSGGIYFLSPEQLDGSEGSPNEPNLYLADPGDAPDYVTTLESRATGPSPLPTSHPFSHTFGEFNNPTGVGVNVSSGNIFVFEEGTGSVKKFDSEGAPSNFSSLGSNTIGGHATFAGFSQMAVDSSGGLTDGNIYVTHNVFGAGTLRVYDDTGLFLGQLNGSTTPQGNFGFFPTGVAVDDDGTVYVSNVNADFTTGRINRYVPIAGVVSDASYDSQIQLGSIPNKLAADSTGAVYAHTFGTTQLRKYTAAQFGAAAPSGSLIDSNSSSVGVDLADDHAYVSRGGTIVEYLSDGAPHGTFGSGNLTNAQGVAIDSSTSRIYAADAVAGRVAVFETELGADPRLDNPVVINAISDGERRRTTDFQVNPNGSAAVFPSTLPLTGYENGALTQLYRHDSVAGGFDCVSCAPSGIPPKGDATMASNGLSLTDDGRVFFNSPERLVLRDSNGVQDVYEWSPAEERSELISTGTSDTDSSLLSVTADGTDAFFFTRQKLVPQDLNGPTVKVYTAREAGGFFELPPQQPCRASDECRGAGTQPALAAPIATDAGTPGQVRKEGKQCDAKKLARKARRLTRQAKALRRRAKASSGQSKGLRRRAKRASVAAKRSSRAAKRCRQAARRSSSDRRAGK